MPADISHRETSREPLAYRMRKGVSYHVKRDSLILILGFPLRTIILNPYLRPLFDPLSAGDFIPFNRMTRLIENTEPDEIEILLNKLVRSGFLEYQGISPLAEHPFVSIIIPVRNRPEDITACLHSLNRVEYPPNKMEIIVVDDASDDHTPDAVSQFDVSLITLEEHQQASFCRNLGAQKAEGEILAFIDSDCLADPLWLRELVPAFKDASLGAVGGLVDSYFEEKGLDHYEKVKSSLKMGDLYRRSGEGDRFFYVPSCNLLARREPFLKVGGFQKEMYVGEDVDFCWRLQDDGYQVEYRPVGRVYHKHRNRLRPFCFRRFEYGTSEPTLQGTHGKRVKQLVFPPAASIFWGLVALAAIFKWPPWLGLGVTVLLIDAAAKFVKTRRRGVPIEFSLVLAAVFRGCLTFFYHFSAFVSRYYLVLSIGILPFVPPVSMVIIGMHLLTCVVQYFIRRPRLSFLSFSFYFSLEQLSYQMGVWWGCLKKFYFAPVNPQIVGRPPLKGI